jgi:hypothetical protein
MAPTLPLFDRTSARPRGQLRQEPTPLLREKEAGFDAGSRHARIFAAMQQIRRSRKVADITVMTRCGHIVVMVSRTQFVGEVVQVFRDDVHRHAGR